MYHITFIGLVWILLVLDIHAQKLEWQDMPTLVFDLEKYDSKTIYSYHLFLKPELLNESQFEPFESEAKPLDIYNYWEKRGEEDYQILLTKTAYAVTQSVSFFTPELLADQKFIASTMPEAELSGEDSVYRVAVGFGSPDIDYSLKFFEPDEFNRVHPKLKDYFEKYDHFDKVPTLISVQHNYRYGRVLFQRTSKMSISMTRYYDLGGKQTMVLNYTLNYIYNIPPEFIGGKEFLLEKIKEGIMALVRETKNVCEKSNQ